MLMNVGMEVESFKRCCIIIYVMAIDERYYESGGWLHMVEW